MAPRSARRRTTRRCPRCRAQGSAAGRRSCVVPRGPSCSSAVDGRERRCGPSEFSPRRAESREESGAPSFDGRRAACGGTGVVAGMAPRADGNAPLSSEVGVRGSGSAGTGAAFVAGPNEKRLAPPVPESLALSV
eukprot:1994092-Prymnesium_polylepis.1